MGYKLINLTSKGKAAAFKLEGYENDWKLVEAMNLADEFPETAVFKMDKDFADHTLITDFLYNFSDLLVINEKVKQFFIEQDVEDVEYLPLKVVDLKRKPLSGNYYLVNFTLHDDCIDQEVTTFDWNPLDEEMMINVENLTIIEEKCDEKKLLTAKYLAYPTLISDEFIAALETMKFTGLEFVDISEFEE